MRGLGFQKLLISYQVLLSFYMQVICIQTALFCPTILTIIISIRLIGVDNMFIL